MGRPHPSAPRVALMTTTYEFASIGWVDAYEDVVREEMAGVDTGGVPFALPASSPTRPRRCAILGRPRWAGASRCAMES